MIFTLDIGNTNIKTALFDGDRMVKYWRVFHQLHLYLG